jgi:hypothetical protein
VVLGQEGENDHVSDVGNDLLWSEDKTARTTNSNLWIIRYDIQVSRRAVLTEWVARAAAPVLVAVFWVWVAAPPPTLAQMMMISVTITVLLDTTTAAPLAGLAALALPATSDLLPLLAAAWKLPAMASGAAQRARTDENFMVNYISF